MSNQDNNTPQTRAAAVLDWGSDKLDQLTDRMERFTGRTLTRGPVAALAAAGLLVGGAALFVASWLFYQVLSLLDWLFGGQAATEAGNTGLSLGQALAPIGHVALDPIITWMTAHSTGLPVSVTHLLLAWVASGAALFLGGLFGFRGARVGWPVYGVLTAAMAWFGAEPAHRPVAAGVVALAWAVLSIFVLHRGGTARPIHITNVLPKPTDA